MHELVVIKLYEAGKIDDAIKMRFIEDIYDTQKPLTRNTLLKIIDNFLRQEEVVGDNASSLLEEDE